MYKEGANDGTLSGTVPVTLVPAPATGVSQRIRIVRAITIHNCDTAAVVPTVRYVHSTLSRKIWQGTLAVGDTWECDLPIVLDDTDKSITAVLAGAASANQPDFTSSWIENT